MRTSAIDDKRLRIYLNDHRAGASAGVALCRRCLANNRASEHEAMLRELTRQMVGERAEFISIMSRLGVPRDPIKLVTAWALERLGRLKLNGQIRGYSPLSRLWELEGLKLAATAKGSLWRSLREIAAFDDRIAGVDFGRLIAQADEQIEALERHRLEAARAALAA